MSGGVVECRGSRRRPFGSVCGPFGRRGNRPGPDMISNMTTTRTAPHLIARFRDAVDWSAVALILIVAGIVALYTVDVVGFLRLLG